MLHLVLSMPQFNSSCRGSPSVSTAILQGVIAIICRDQADDAMERKVQQEMKEHSDILRVDSTDTYADLASKTLKLFSQLPEKYDASFYFKVRMHLACTEYRASCTSAPAWVSTVCPCSETEMQTVDKYIHGSWIHVPLYCKALISSMPSWLTTLPVRVSDFSSGSMRRDIDIHFCSH